MVLNQNLPNASPIWICSIFSLGASVCVLIKSLDVFSVFALFRRLDEKNKTKKNMPVSNLQKDNLPRL